MVSLRKFGFNFTLKRKKADCTLEINGKIYIEKYIEKYDKLKCAEKNKIDWKWILGIFLSLIGLILAVK